MANIVCLGGRCGSFLNEKYIFLAFRKYGIYFKKIIPLKKNHHTKKKKKHKHVRGLRNIPHDRQIRTFQNKVENPRSTPPKIYRSYA